MVDRESSHQVFVDVVPDPYNTGIWRSDTADSVTTLSIALWV
jgi:hypothetical protein